MPKIFPDGDMALTVEFGNTIDPALYRQVMALDSSLQSCSVPGIIESVPSYASLTVYYNPVIITYPELAELIRHTLKNAVRTDHSAKKRLFRIPVIYGGDYGPDLERVAELTGLGSSEIIRLHSTETYLVYILGFKPGFPYLGKVPDALCLPRLDTPRPKVAAGSVGIAGRQTGIYPVSSPGGWHILGRTPVKIFDMAREKPFLFSPGDQVRFVPVDKAEYMSIREQVIEGTFDYNNLW